MTTSTPPRPPRLSDPVDREELEALVKALIDEARQRARRRRQKYAAFAVVASLVAVGITTILERSTGEQQASLALAARSSVAQGAGSTIAFITSPRACSAWGCPNGPPPHRAGDLVGKLYVVNADGSGLRLVAERASIAASPAWSPDAQKLLFQSRGAIYAVNADGSGLQSLTRSRYGDSSAAWSPNGQKIAFVRIVRVRPAGPGAIDADFEIYVMNADGSERQDLTRNPGWAVYANPAWSPDGLKIAFQRRLEGNSEIYVMNADGSGQRRLTRNAASDAFDAWSPGGQKIVFQRRLKGGIWRGLQGGNWEIFVVNADGSGQRNLTRKGSHELDADWSPDGRRIVFRTSRHGKWELYAMNADGTAQRRLTRTASANESRPSWSADGQKIAFTREVGGNFELYVMNADGSGQRRLTPNSPVDRWVAFAWSP